MMQSTIQFQHPQIARRPRILFFAQNHCWPPDTGAKLRNYYLVRELARFADVTYLGFARSTDEVNERDGLRDLCERIITVPLEGAYSLGKIVRGLFGKTALSVLNYTTEAMTRQLTQVLSEQSFDAVQVEVIHLTAYWSILKTARNSQGNRSMLVCDWHNIESELMRRYSERAIDPARRLYARITAQRLAALEKQMLPNFDVHTVVSKRERDKLLALHLPVSSSCAVIDVIENGVDVTHFSPTAIAQAYENWDEQQLYPARRRILFVGSMDYHANIDAVVYFANEVWPRLYERKPELQFTIVGRQPPAEVRALAKRPGIEVTGTVEDVRPFYREAVASVVPLRIGSGSRLKILEAMAAGVPVVSTKLGAEGVAVTDGENILLADTPTELYFTLLEVVGNPAKQQQLARAALELVRATYDWETIGATLCQTYQRVLNQPQEQFAHVFSGLS